MGGREKFSTGGQTGSRDGCLKIEGGLEHPYELCDKNTKQERVIRSPEFLVSASIWSHLVHSLPGLDYICKTKHKTLGNG